ncbi:MAG: hypothetical protein H6815_00460 [Phycisphaeraceae bacterium]|nr:hypothetical protein [Phycisphaerales bacterium]MCB9858896.1 hypothetical protein [Phycisphaeraceae bacterium]
MNDENTPISAGELSDAAGTTDAVTDKESLRELLINGPSGGGDQHHQMTPDDDEAEPDDADIEDTDDTDDAEPASESEPDEDESDRTDKPDPKPVSKVAPPKQAVAPQAAQLPQIEEPEPAPRMSEEDRNKLIDELGEGPAKIIIGQSDALAEQTDRANKLEHSMKVQQQQAQMAQVDQIGKTIDSMFDSTGLVDFGSTASLTATQHQERNRIVQAMTRLSVAYPDATLEQVFEWSVEPVRAAMLASNAKSEAEQAQKTEKIAGHLIKRRRQITATPGRAKNTSSSGKPKNKEELRQELLKTLR